MKLLIKIFAKVVVATDNFCKEVEMEILKLRVKNDMPNDKEDDNGTT